MNIETVITGLSSLTIAAQIILPVGVIYFFLLGKGKESWLGKIIGQKAVRLAFLVALVATAGSLFFSEVAGYEPCRLCWFQRIFMYPETILLGLAWLKKESKIVDCALSLAIIGAAISLYHNYIYYLAQKTAFCSAAAPCTTPYVLEFGYITIPLMALTAFLSLIFLIGVQKSFGNSK